MIIADTVNEWFRERLAGGALARDTAAYNQVHAALPELVARLSGTGAAPTADDPASPAATPAKSKANSEVPAEG